MAAIRPSRNRRRGLPPKVSVKSSAKRVTGLPLVRVLRIAVKEIGQAASASGWCCICQTWQSSWATRSSSSRSARERSRIVHHARVAVEAAEPRQPEEPRRDPDPHAAERHRPRIERRAGRAAPSRARARLASPVSTSRRYSVPAREAATPPPARARRPLGPAFRTYERLVSLRPRPAAPVDGPPLPPRRLMVRVAGTADADWFLRSGRAAYDAIAAHVPLDEIESVLDFGCGCGRVTRYWATSTAPSPAATSARRRSTWCRDEPRRSRRFERNALAPPLAFADESFDLVYALSVFTHLTAELQLAWRDELRRVLRPGGRLLVTTHGRSYLPRLDDGRARAVRARRARRPLGRRRPARTSAARTTPSATSATRSRTASTFLELEPEGARGNPTQDLVLLRRR